MRPVIRLLNRLRRGQRRRRSLPQPALAKGAHAVRVAAGHVARRKEIEVVATLATDVHAPKVIAARVPTEAEIAPEVDLTAAVVAEVVVRDPAILR